MISDGKVDTYGYGAKVLGGEHLAKAEHGGAWLERVLRTGIEQTRADMFLKIDPDTLVLRPLIPPAGDVVGRWFHNSVAGGLYGVSRSAAEKILSSGWLSDPANTALTYKPYPDGLEYQQDDHYIAECARALGLQCVEWDGLEGVRYRPHWTLSEVRNCTGLAVHPVR